MTLLLAPGEVNDATHSKQSTHNELFIFLLLALANKLNVVNFEAPVFTIPFRDAYNASYLEIVRNRFFTIGFCQ